MSTQDNDSDKDNGSDNDNGSVPVAVVVVDEFEVSMLDYLHNLAYRVESRYSDASELAADRYVYIAD